LARRKAKSTGTGDRKVARIELDEQQRQQLVSELGLAGRMEQVPTTVEVVRCHRNEAEGVKRAILSTFGSTGITPQLGQTLINPASLVLVLA
jgi:hypothetical protein